MPKKKKKGAKKKKSGAKKKKKGGKKKPHRKNPKRVAAAKRNYKKSGLYKYNQRSKKKGKKKGKGKGKKGRRPKNFVRTTNRHGRKRARRQGLNKHQKAFLARMRALRAGRATPGTVHVLPLPG